MQHTLKVLMLFDWGGEIPPNGNYRSFLRGNDEWRHEASVYRSLKRLGHEIELFGLYDNLEEFMNRVKEFQPDVVFNLNEAFRGDRKMESNVVSVLELMEIPYTGCGPLAMELCRNKALSKEILSQEGIPVPQFVVSSLAHPLTTLKDLPFPVIVKPIDLEASEGISEKSYCRNEKEALEQMRNVHQEFETDVIIEEYIEGREFYVSVLGNKKLTVFPPRELFFRKWKQGPRFATYRVKWDEKFRKKRGLRNGLAWKLSPSLEKEMQDYAKKAFKLLGMKGYGRIDFRMREDGEIYFLEANPNPGIAGDEDYASSARKYGFTYDEIVSKILSLAIS